MAKVQTSPRQQVAALPWRLAGGGIEIMLVTSRETKRWVVPKGWPMRGRSAAQSAAQEAFEEGGVHGVVSKTLGQYSYDKRLSDGRLLNLSVDLFALRVKEQLADWPEKQQRVARWFHPAEAARLVAEPELSELIAAFAAGGFMRCA